MNDITINLLCTLEDYWLLLDYFISLRNVNRFNESNYKKKKKYTVVIIGKRVLILIRLRVNN